MIYLVAVGLIVQINLAIYRDLAPTGRGVIVLAERSMGVFWLALLVNRVVISLS
jgi:hypothetical protein